MSEAGPAQIIPFFDLHRDLLRRWIHSEIWNKRLSCLEDKAKFPPPIYETTVQDPPDNWKLRLLQSLSNCETITSMSHLLGLTKAISQDNSDQARYALKTLVSQTVLPHEAVQEMLSIIRRSGENASAVNERVFSILGKHAVYVMGDMAEFVGYKISYIRTFAANTLFYAVQSGAISPQVTIEAVAALLRNVNMRLPDGIIGIVLCLTPESHDARDALLTRLRHPDQTVVPNTIVAMAYSIPGIFWESGGSTLVKTKLLLEAVALLQSPNNAIAEIVQKMLAKLRQSDRHRV
jgi:hypothetical protein